MIRFDILSVFPEMFSSPLQASLLKKAQEKGLIDVRLWDTASMPKINIE